MTLTLELIRSKVSPSIIDFTLLHQGENDSYLLKDSTGWGLILKQYRLNRLQQLDTKTEVELMQELAQRGIKTSEHLKFLSGSYIENLGSRHLSLQKVISGHMLYTPNVEDYRNLGKHLKSLHSKTIGINNQISLPLLNFETVIEANWPNVINANFLNRDILREITYYKDLVRDQFDFSLKSLIHFDAHLGNLIFVNNEIFFIDWEESGYGNPVLDIAVCNTHFQREENPKEHLRSIREGYGEELSLEQIYIGTIAKLLSNMGNIPGKQDILVLKEPLKVFQRYLGYFKSLAREAN